MAGLNVRVNVNFHARGLDVLAAAAWVVELTMTACHEAGYGFATSDLWIDAGFQLRAVAILLTFVAWQSRRIKTAREAYELRDRELDEKQAEVVQLQSRIGGQPR